jgi:periplasmic copper chaperone A
MTAGKKVWRRAMLAAAAGALAAPGVAGAHVTVQPSELEPGGFARMDVRVPNERDKADTTKVQVEMPPGFFFINYEPKPGWRIAIRREKLSKPTEVFGERQTEQVRDVTITSTTPGKGIAPGQFEDFGLSGGPVPGKAGQTLSFKALQTYSNGEVVRWIAPDPEAETPASQVKLAGGEESQSAPASGDDDSGSASKGLGIAALMVGGLALVAGLAALMLARRQRVAA